jgi:phosphopantetheinyl transferase
MNSFLLNQIQFAFALPEVHLIEELQALFDYSLKVLQPDELVELSKKSHPRVQREFCLCRGLIHRLMQEELRHIESKSIGNQAADWIITKKPSGQPYIKSKTTNLVLHSLSISHSQNGGAVAIGSKEDFLGIDLQRLGSRQESDLREPAWFDRLLSPGEIDWVYRQGLLTAYSRFLVLWSVREAIVKATGKVGLARLELVDLASIVENFSLESSSLKQWSSQERLKTRPIPFFLMNSISQSIRSSSRIAGRSPSPRLHDNRRTQSNEATRSVTAC